MMPLSYASSMAHHSERERRVEAYLEERAGHHQEMADRYRRLTVLLFREPLEPQPTCRDNDGRPAPGVG